MKQIDLESFGMDRSQMDVLRQQMNEIKTLSFGDPI
jgi:hypothetical protein